MKRIVAIRLAAVLLVIALLTTSLGWGGGPGSWTWTHMAESSSVYPVDTSTIEQELRWLEASETELGALAQNPTQTDVVPYFANLAALSIVGENPRLVRRYLDWYLNHLNRPDRFGMYGTIYDYRLVSGGTEIPTLDYDSADSYAATLLSLAADYVRVTRDAGWAESRLDDLQSVAEVIVRLQDRDGLVWAKPGYGVKFLMDNAENYRGLLDWAWLLDELGHKREADIYRARAEWVRQGIETKLWNPWRGYYEWSLGGVMTPSLGPRWYPETVAQLYPIVFGVIDPKSDRARLVYAKMMNQFPRWAEGVTGDPFPWAVTAYAAVLVGDVNSARVYLSHSAEKWPTDGPRGPWYAAESGFLIRTTQLLDQLAGKASAERDANADAGLNGRRMD